MADILDLYNECRRRRLNVRGLAGWTNWQVGYWYRRENQWSGSGSRSNPPTFFVNHHTATSAYTPNVKNSKGQSKANIWLGLDRGNTGSGRMYETGDGVARADFAVRWAANYGNGACVRSVYERYVWRDRVAPNKPSGSDDGYANKLGIGMEIIHRGGGQLCHPSVFELAAQINAAAMHVFEWSIAQILDHRSSTPRKVDVRFKQEEGEYTINALRTRILEIVEGTVPVEPPDPGEDEMVLSQAKGSSGPTVTHYQERLMSWRSTALPISGADGDYGAETTQWVQSFQNTEKILPATGDMDGVTTSRLDSYAEDRVDQKLRDDLVSVQVESRTEDRAIRADCCGDGGDGSLPDHTHVAGGVTT